MKNNDKILYSWKELEKDCRSLADKVKPIKFNFKSIYGIPRGGLFVAAILSYLLDIPLIFNKKQINKNTLVVDDISDTGNTLKKIKGIKNKMVITLWANPASKVFPNYYIKIKKEKWIVFPWETLLRSKIDNTKF